MTIIASNQVLHEKLTGTRGDRVRKEASDLQTCPTRYRSLFDHDQPRNKDNGQGAVQLDRYLSLEGIARVGSTLKGTATQSCAADLINLGVGRPSPHFYPWTFAAFEVVDCKNQGCQDPPITDVQIHSANKAHEYDLTAALGYENAAGSPQLVHFMTEHVNLIHNPPYRDWQTCLTCGTSSALDIIFRVLCNRGDWIMFEALSYPGAIEAVKPLGLNLLAIKMDNEGPIPDDLDFKLTSWDANRGSRPKVLYMIPSGHNPTGVTQTIERRRALYRMSEKHDFLIIEDDPYFFLQLGRKSRPMEDESDNMSEVKEYLNSLPNSYLSLDVSGRVIRLESTSKILAPGLRCGWITGAAKMIHKFLSHTDATTISPSGPSQLMMYQLLVQKWGHGGFLEWLCRLANKYRSRRDLLLKAAKRYLPIEICNWTVPETGMFVWIDIDWTKHPAYHDLQDDDQDKAFILEVEERIFRRARENGVSISRGSWFGIDITRSNGLGFRLTYGAASEDALREGIERFGRVICDDFALI